MALLALPARSAELVDVRVGQHPDFTRVVFEFDRSGGYQLTRKGDLLLLKLDARADAERIPGSGPLIASVEVAAAEGGCVARIQLRRPDLRVREMLLSHPPRVVVDLSIDPDAQAAPAPPASAARPAGDEAGRGQARKLAETAPVIAPSSSRAPAGPDRTASAAAPRSAPAPMAPLPTEAVEEVGAATHLFTGFQMDDQAQYFTYLGLKQNLWQGLGLAGYLQLFGAAQSYEYESDDQDIDARVQHLTPSLGVTRAFGDGAWTVSALVGPQLRWKREEGFLNGSRRDFDVGVFAQAETLYWRKTHSLQGIASYASLDDFFFGRARGKLLAWSPEAGCCSLFAGLDVAGMGNRDFRALQTGPVLEVPIGRYFVLGRGGYQHDSNFGSGAYSGLEIYAPF